jgi:hypothetical protein
MKLRHSLAILAVAALAACSSDEGTTTRRSAGGAGTNTNNTNTNGGTTGGGTTSLGAVTVKLEAPTASGNAGSPLQVIATVSMGASPVTDGTTVTFTSVPNTNITYSVAGGTVQTVAGKASLTVDSSVPQKVSVSAAALGVASSLVDLNYIAAPLPKAKTVTVTFSSSSVTVSDPLSTKDSATVYVNVIGDDDLPWVGTVTLTASDGSLVQSSLTTDASGNAQTVFNAATRLGTVTITGTAGQGGAKGTGSLIVGPAAPLTIEAVSAEPMQIGVAGSDAIETSTVTFKVTDKFGNPVSDATLVSFKVVPTLGGVSITPASGGLYTVGGLVSPVVKSGYKSGTVRVIATIGAPFVASPITASSNSITVFGAAPDARSLELIIASDKTVISGYDMSLIQVPFTISMTDNYGNPVRPGTPISVYCSEGGLCGNNNDTGIQTDAKGNASFVFQSGFSNKIWSTAATQGKARFLETGIGQNHTWPAMFSDQNGRVRVTIAALGRTSWYDADQDGVFDATEGISFDPPEPFEDFNGSGTRDTTTPFEPYIDELFSGVTGAHFTAGVYNTHTEGGGPAFHSQQTIWTFNDVIYSAGPKFWYAPEFINDSNADGLFTEWTDMPIVGAYGGPFNPAANPRALGYAGLVSTATIVEFYIGDANGHALPPGSTLTVTLDDTSMPLEIKGGTYTVANGAGLYKTWPVTLKHKSPGIDNRKGEITRLVVEYAIKDLGTKVTKKIPIQVW